MVSCSLLLETTDIKTGDKHDGIDILDVLGSALSKLINVHIWGFSVTLSTFKQSFCFYYS